LVALAEQMEQEGITDNVYAVYSIDDIKARWAKVNADTDAIEPALTSERARLEGDDKLCKEFADKAAAFAQWAEQQRSALAGVSGEPSVAYHRYLRARVTLCVC
jgi:hypothetical protein